MRIREAKIDEAEIIKALHDRSALALCRADYTVEQLEDWVNASTVARYRERLKLHRTFVAEKDGEIVGFVRWNPPTQELCSLFVDPAYTR